MSWIDGALLSVVMFSVGYVLGHVDAAKHYEDILSAIRAWDEVNKELK